MTKYKLIKEYPGSPTLGTISYRTNEHSCIFEYANQKQYSTEKIAYESYPEFWKKVVEKDYEILAFRRDDLKSTFYKLSNGKFGSNINHKEGYFTEESMLLHLTYDLDRFHIYSVKRLSDGEIFTIGDNLRNGCINKFFLKDNNITFTTVLNLTKRGLYWAKKIVKQPLFTTEDGVDIYEGDTFYIINSIWVPVEIRAYYPSTSKTFSTKEAAEEYILMNKPCLNVTEIIKKWDKFGNDEFYFTRSLKELVKSKI